MARHRDRDDTPRMLRSRASMPMHFASMLLLFIVLAGAWLPVASAQLAPVDPWEADIARFEAADRVAPPTPGATLFIGSSSIRFWESLQEDFPGVRIVRRGFGGSEVRDATRFAGRIVVPYRPRLVLLYAGDNDLAAGRTPTQVRDDVAAFAARIRRDLPDAAFAYIAIKPSPARANLLDAAREANTLVAAWAKTQPHTRYIDVFTPMLDAEGRAREDLFGPDRLHMNRAGYRIWIERIGPVIGTVPKS